MTRMYDVNSGCICHRYELGRTAKLPSCPFTVESYPLHAAGSEGFYGSDGLGSGRGPKEARQRGCCGRLRLSECYGKVGDEPQLDTVNYVLIHHNPKHILECMQYLNILGITVPKKNYTHEILNLADSCCISKLT